MDDLMKLAQRAGIGKVPGGWVASAPSLAEFARLIRADERERCAKVCDFMAGINDTYFADDCAIAIRALED